MATPLGAAPQATDAKHSWQDIDRSGLTHIYGGYKHRQDGGRICTSVKVGQLELLAITFDAITESPLKTLPLPTSNRRFLRFTVRVRLS